MVSAGITKVPNTAELKNEMVLSLKQVLMKGAALLYNGSEIRKGEYDAVRAIKESIFFCVFSILVHDN